MGRKSEARNSKSETNSKDQNPKREASGVRRLAFAVTEQVIDVGSRALKPKYTTRGTASKEAVLPIRNAANIPLDPPSKGEFRQAFFSRGSEAHDPSLGIRATDSATLRVAFAQTDRFDSRRSASPDPIVVARQNSPFEGGSRGMFFVIDVPAVPVVFEGNPFYRESRSTGVPPVYPKNTGGTPVLLTSQSSALNVSPLQHSNLFRISTFGFRI